MRLKKKLDLESKNNQEETSDAGLKSCRAKKKLLSEKARQKHLQWALEHPSVNWTNCMFKNESRFCVVNDRHVIMRRRPGEECLYEMPLHYY